MKASEGWRRERDSNPRYPSGYSGFQDRRLKPLGHLSGDPILPYHDSRPRPVKDRLRLPLRFDVAALQTDLHRIDEVAWVRHFVTQNYEGDWTVLPLRAPATASHPVQMIYSDPACDRYADTPLMGGCPAIAAALGAFECPLESVRLMRLGAGSVIKTHCDHDLDVEHGRVRLHVPIVTNPEVDFRLNGERVALSEGECWYLRLSDPHSVRNGGDRDRIHLVIDAVVSPWLQGLLERADIGA
jgi:hypothetical protein